MEMDGKDVKTVRYKDVLANDCYDVISDASPSLKQISIGTRVCVRHNQALFVEGVVCSICDTHPVRFIVAVLGEQRREITVGRAELRLLRPPWWDELENLNRLTIQEQPPTMPVEYYSRVSPPPQHNTPVSVCTPNGT